MHAFVMFIKEYIVLCQKGAFIAFAAADWSVISSLERNIVFFAEHCQARQV